MSRRVLINNRWPLILPDSSADEWEGNMKYHGDRWEMERLKALEAIIKDTERWGNTKPVVMYIGAYKGDMPALLASWFAELILMESTAAFWTLIKQTWDLNPGLPEPVGFWSGLVGRHTDLHGIAPAEWAVWPARTAQYIEGQVGFSHLAESKDDPNYPVISIDTFVGISGIVPDIITMDVEGSELEILYGGQKTLIDHSPEFMISVHPEFMFHNHGTYERELHDLLRNNKYNGRWLDYDHEHHWLYKKEVTK